MDIIKNLKPLKPTGNETKEELLIRLEKWTKWYEETVEKIELDCKEKITWAETRVEVANKIVIEHDCAKELTRLKGKINRLDNMLHRISAVISEYDYNYS